MSNFLERLNHEAEQRELVREINKRDLEKWKKNHPEYVPGDFTKDLIKKYGRVSNQTP